MRFVQVSGYLDGKFTGYQIVYYTSNQAYALAKFRKDFPISTDWICIAEYIYI